MISTTGGRDSDPSPLAATIADHIAGQNLLAGILAALSRGSTPGGGSWWRPRCSAARSGPRRASTRYLMTGQISGPANRGHPMIPGIYAIFRTRDGWIAIVGVAGPARDLFFETIGRPDLIERFGQLLYFEEDKAELFPILDDVFATKSTAEWCGLLTAAGLRFAPVRDHAEVVADPGVWVNGYVAERKDPEAPPGSDHPVVRPPVRFSQATPEPETQVPELGQHTEEVLLQAGYSWDEIGALSTERVI